MTIECLKCLGLMRLELVTDLLCNLWQVRFTILIDFDL